jgi:hypothetical protein
MRQVRRNIFASRCSAENVGKRQPATRERDKVQLQIKTPKSGGYHGPVPALQIPANILDNGPILVDPPESPRMMVFPTPAA